MLDGIIRIFEAHAETLARVERTLASRCERPVQWIVTNETGSSWPQLQALAARMQASYREPTDDAGPLEAALGEHSDRDVVIVDGGVETPEGWLDRLAACAEREPQVATASPFSNDGLVCGYPQLRGADGLPPGESVASLDGLFSRENRAAAFEIPFPFLPCFYLTRRAIVEARVSPMGDEGDAAVATALSACKSGLRHMLAGDVFVETAGGRRWEPVVQSILARFPDVAAAWADFARREPARPLRRNVDIARLRASPRPRLLFVTHPWGGGVERHVLDLARMLEEDCEALLLRPAGKSHVGLRWLRDGEDFAAWFHREDDWDSLLALLRAIGVDRMHLHHVHGLPQRVLALPGDLGIPYDVTLHDYFAICPQYHLADESGAYCGEPDAGGCEACIAKRPAQWPLAIDEWRRVFHEFLAHADRVIAPSNDLAERMRRYFPDVELRVWPHPDAPSAAARMPFKIALLGGISPIKGLAVLDACARDAAARRLPLHFHVIGHIDKPIPLWPDLPLTIGGSYRDEDLRREIALERPDAFLFLSQVPESHSYTLTAALETGLPIVATRIGAFIERLRSHRAHAFVPVGATGAQINDALLGRLMPATNAVAAVSASPP